MTMRGFITIALLVLLLPVSGLGHGRHTEPVILDWSQSSAAKTWRGGLLVRLHLSVPVPYGLIYAQDPPRLGVRLLSVVDPKPGTQNPQEVTLSPTFEGAIVWVPLADPMVVDRAEMSDGPQGAMLKVLLKDTTETDFAAAVDRSQSQVPLMGMDPPVTPVDSDLFHVVLDPGHGGHDPGAEHGGIREADLVLRFAGELQTVLEDRGVHVSLTRQTDRFVPLAARVAHATESGADVFVSLHADALEQGRASGASVHTLPQDVELAANAFLVDRLGQDALGSTTGPMDDAIAQTLMEVVRRRTSAESQRLSDSLVGAMEAAQVQLYKAPLKSSNFVVLRAADVPSVLVELGFLSEPEDRARLTDPAWRARMADALADGLMSWQDAAP